MKPQDILAMFFAAKDDSREFMQAPILRGQWIYATNGHVVVRVPVQDGIDAKETDRIQKLEALFSDNVRSEFMELPVLPVAEKCPACNGTGQSDEGDPDDKAACWNCDGTGEELHRSVPVGIQLFAHRYLAKIKQLPGLQFSPSGDEMGAGYFTFEGGEGLIMPMRK